ncbi:LysR family transcriptional regulator [Paenibacillus terreus]|uniref:LysR family transcriptional regulator n=1 Tax=Paenibacillus terreus TaxID=1387834 RepID=A0ABV5BI29_9BACL
MVELGSLTKSAEALGFTQSGISHTISSKSLELLLIVRYSEFAFDSKPSSMDGIAAGSRGCVELAFFVFTVVLRAFLTLRH